MESTSKWSDNRKFYTLFIIMIFAIGIFSLWNYKKENKSDTPESQIAETAKSSFIYDLEEPLDLENTKIITDGEAVSGTHRSIMNDTLEYGVTFVKRFSEIANFKKVKTVKYTFKWKSVKPLKSVLAVLSVSDADNNQKEWQGKTILKGNDAWNLSESTFTLKGADFNPSDIVRIYLWNKDKETFVIDDITINFK